jgi:hypothetical protein
VSFLLALVALIIGVLLLLHVAELSVTLIGVVIVLLAAAILVGVRVLPPAVTLQAGDVGFHHDTGPIACAIRYFERRKYGKPWSAESSAVKGPAWSNHVFLMDGPDTLVEANPQGVQLSPLSKYVGQYQPTDTVFYRPVYPEADGAAVATRAMQASVGEKYDDLTIVSDALYLLFSRFNVRFGLEDRATCSGVVAHALELAGIDLGEFANCSTPADVYAVGQRDHWAPVGV